MFFLLHLENVALVCYNIIMGVKSMFKKIKNLLKKEYQPPQKSEEELKAEQERIARQQELLKEYPTQYLKIGVCSNYKENITSPSLKELKITYERFDCFLLKKVPVVDDGVVKILTGEHKGTILNYTINRDNFDIFIMDDTGEYPNCYSIVGSEVYSDKSKIFKNLSQNFVTLEQIVSLINSQNKAKREEAINKKLYEEQVEQIMQAEFENEE